MEEQKEGFSFTYSAKDQEEIERIRARYLPMQQEKMEQLRTMDRSVTRPGTIISLAVGISCTLLFGLGLTCVTVWQSTLFTAGIIIGVVSMVGMALSYPLYLRITEKEWARLAPEILALSEELKKP